MPYLAFEYARLTVGLLASNLASLALIKVFCSRFWQIGSTSTMLSESSKHQGARVAVGRLAANG